MRPLGYYEDITFTRYYSVSQPSLAVATAPECTLRPWQGFKIGLQARGPLDLAAGVGDGLRTS